MLVYVSSYDLDLTISLAVFVATTLAISEVVIRIISGISRRAGAPPALSREIREILSIVMLAILAAGIAKILGITSEFTTLTVSGIAGLAVSLALQSTLSNIISGILLLHDKILKLGDEILYSGIRGKVIRIGLRNTWVQTKEDTIVMISNTSLAGGPLTNFTAGVRIKHDIDRSG